MAEKSGGGRYERDLWERNTLIKDAVHGYISIPKPVMREIVDTETFQRLKNIQQTGMEALYPSATHNRFMHSLGVYHLSKKAFSCFRQNVKADFETIYGEVRNRFVDHADQVWDRWELMFRLACLLHDCGHSPFSHTLEFIYDLPVEKTLNDRLVEELSEPFKADAGYDASKVGDGAIKMCGAPHERMSALFLRKKGDGYFGDKVERLLKDYVGKLMPERSIYEKNSRALEDDIEFMIRMIIGCRYNFEKADDYYAKNFYDEDNRESWRTELQLRNCIIGLLNSKLDVDNLDYVIRDTKYSGYANHNVDVERLLSSLTIVTGFELEDVELKKGEELDCCVNLKKFEGSYVNARIAGACSMGSHTQDILAHGKVCLEGGQEKSEATQRSMRTGGRFSAQVTFPIEAAGENGDRISISPLLDSAESGSVCYLNIRGHLEGRFTGTILKNDADIPPEWKDFGRRRIFPAYYQNSMSVLMSAIDGSNFEKKWIYSHQTSTFTNNFLNVYLLEKYAQILMHKEREGFKKKLDGLVEELKVVPAENRTDLTDGEKCGQEQIQELKDRIECYFVEDFHEVTSFLDTLPAGENVQELLVIFDLLITYKKVFNEENHPSLLDIIKEIAVSGKTLGVEAYGKIKALNEEYLKLRGKEIQYFWDIVAMCEEKTIMGRHFSKSSDEDLAAAYKQEYLEPLEENEGTVATNSRKEFSDNYEYLVKRNYMRCMWKSYPEYQFYFQDWTNEELAELDEILKPHSVPVGFGYLVLSDTIGENRAGNLQREFWEYLKKEYSLKRFVSVNQVIKTKQFAPYETYIKRGCQVVRLEDIGLFSSIKKDENFRFFYYDQEAGGKRVDIVEILNWLREKIVVENKKKEVREVGHDVWDRKRDVIIRDNIYGNISVPYKIRMLIDCREFQRLRRISQLATAGQVFPGAVQNRFSHSLGVYHMMNKIVAHFEERLRDIGYAESIKPRDKDAILAAALLHDIGHGPFSHAFEDAGINRDSFSHEYWTKRIITSAETDINRTLRKIWGEDFPDLVMSYIDCRNEVKDGKFGQKRYSKNGLDLKFIFASLVSSQLDADRMDYLLRDSKACGVTYGQFDADRLIEGMSVTIHADGELKVGVEKEYLNNVEEYFYARYMMYNNIYYHPFKILTEKILQNILREACESYIKGLLKSDRLPPTLAEIFNHARMSLEDFCDLDDHVVMGAIQVWANLNEEGTERLTMLCRCFLNRKGYRRLNLTEPEELCKRLDGFQGDGRGTDSSKQGRLDLICCKKKLQMYKTDPESDVYIINANGTTTRLRQIKGIINRQNEECVLYHCREFTEKFYPGDKELISQLTRQFDIQNSVEIEKKYTVDKTADKDGVINKILEKVEESDYSVTELDPKKQEDVYFDTENETLRRNGFSVRIRECGERRCITCKYKVQSESNGEGGQLERYEAERDIGTGGLEQNEEQIDEAVLTLLKTEKYGAADLLQCVKVINNRKKYVIYKDGTENRRADERYELVVDDVLYQNLLNHNTAKEMQIEIELKSRYETRINMKGLTDSIEEISGLESITESKYIRALKLTEDKRVEISAR